MAWVKVPPEHRPIFLEALPSDGRVQTLNMFGGIAAKVNGHMFAGLFGRSTVLALPEPDREEALALEGAGPFDPMGNGRVMSDKVMLPESMMDEPDDLRRWIARAFALAARLPPKAPKAVAAKKPVKKLVARKPAVRKPAKRPAVNKPSARKPAKKPRR
jgi:TfoX/Sxy family transcriptional regulator of competence genes